VLHSAESREHSDGGWRSRRSAANRNTCWRDSEVPGREMGAWRGSQIKAYRRATARGLNPIARFNVTLCPIIRFCGDDLNRDRANRVEAGKLVTRGSVRHANGMPLTLSVNAVERISAEPRSRTRDAAWATEETQRAATASARKTAKKISNNLRIDRNKCSTIATIDGSAA